MRHGAAIGTSDFFLLFVFSVFAVLALRLVVDVSIYDI